MVESPELIRAQQAMRLAEAEPKRAIAEASAIVRDARSTDPLAVAVAERAWGLALRHAGNLDSAIAHFTHAVRYATACGALEPAGDARLSLAFALSERGRSRAALNQADRALNELRGVARARALTVRGTILLELGRYEEAIRSYRSALPVFRDADDLMWIYRVVWNRGLAHAYRHEFVAAESDLRQAERLADELMLPLFVGFAQANLAFVLGLRGQVAAALEYSLQAEKRIRAHEAQVGELLKDRAELLLSVRLVSEAREAAQESIRAYEREQRGIKLPQVRLVLAQASMLDGNVDDAIHHARRAAREFARQERPEWAALARLHLLTAANMSGRRSRSHARSAEEIVQVFTEARWPGALLEARILAAKLCRDVNRPGRAAEHLREAARARTRGPAMLRARGWYAEALWRMEAGRPRGAISAIRAGLKVLDEHRAALGATDIRAYAAGHRTELADLGLRLALESGQPRKVFEWSERGRANGLLIRPGARPPDDSAVAQALAKLRGIVFRVNELRAHGTDTASMARLMHEQTLLERWIKDRTRSHAHGISGRPGTLPTVTELARHLGDAAFLELTIVDGTVHAVTLVDTRLRWRSLGDVRTVDGLIDRIGFAMRRLCRRDGDAASRAAVRALLVHAAGRVDELILRPLPELADRPLVVVPTGILQSLPWAVLPSCVGRPVTVAPSAALWRSAAERDPVEWGGVLVAAGPDLPGAAAEVRAVARAHGVAPMLPPEATVEAVLAGMEGSALVHLAAHGRLVAHNPLFSDVLLSDGPLLAYDVERLHRPPHTVVLAACESGRSVVCAGDELLGLSATFLAAGSSQLVAALMPVPDAEAASVMVAFHENLASGAPAAMALAAAQLHVAGDDAVETAAACFVSLGAGLSSPLRASSRVMHEKGATDKHEIGLPPGGSAVRR